MAIDKNQPTHASVGAAPSLVTGLLNGRLAKEVQDGLFVPWISQNFSAYLPFLHQANRAHITLLRKQGLLSAYHAAELFQAVGILEKQPASAYKINGALEDLYFNYEAALIDITGEEIGGRLHLGRSRNDLQSTLDRMLARHFAQELLAGTLTLRESLLNKAAETSDFVMPGYTHMQHAQPITFGFYLAGIEQSLQRDTRRLFSALNEINHCPLGAGALAGTTFKLDRAMLAAMLGFEGPVKHTLDR